MLEPRKQLFRFTLLLCVATGWALAGYLSGSVPMEGAQLHWEARRNIVTTLDLDDPLYVPVHGTPLPFYSGIAGLLITRAEGASICTGSLLGDGIHLLTAAHCLADEAGALDALSVQAIFFANDGGTVSTNSTTFFIHPGYTGAVLDDHDIALVRLDSVAPSTVDRHQLYDGNAVGETFEMVGFGRRGQGNTGSSTPSGNRIRGFNQFDAPGASLLPFLGISGADNVLMFDFDNGLASNDAFGFWLGLDGLGLGLFESMLAPGDSGGPNFVGNRIAAVNSFGLTFEFTLTDGTVLTSDVNPGLNSSFGEFAGSTSVTYNMGWLNSILVPEPAPWMLMIAGLVALVLGHRSRSRRETER